ncbi:MAG: response regulator [Cyanobacteria bacterium J069]
MRVTDGSSTWSIYLEEGDLVYASSSIDPFGRLDRHLSKISRHVPGLVSAVRVQLRLLFENRPIYQSELVPDYQAIYWLVNQNHLTSEYTFSLIDSLAKEVIEGFLSVNTGSYELIEKGQFSEWIAFCKIDLRNLVEYCQQRLDQHKPQIAIAQTPDFKTVPIQRGRSQLRFSDANQALETVTASKPTPPIAPASAKLSKEHYTVVCIDDSPTVLRSIQTFLDDAIFSVVMISDPVKALMQIVRSKPDLILLDVTMPNLDGYELCSLLRRHPSFKTVPVVMVTGNTGLIDRAKAKLVGASSYLTKPFNQSDLLKVVFKHLS